MESSPVGSHRGEIKWSCEAATGFFSCMQGCGQDALITCCRMINIGNRVFRMQGFFQQSHRGKSSAGQELDRVIFSAGVLQVSAGMHLGGCLNAGGLVQYTPPHLQRWKRANDSNGEYPTD